ncbi:hypothetical protein V0R48_18620 [Pseudomonas alcaligenes]|jgi:hypothetical protein|uniref:hypothetical protein n=1 Tax=Aquipseudomonas alcaligenes TaxID=43263 RepID=UPI002E7B48C0|nr:hypothetical protein [Pseudomonas alcaligenes]MEE1950997.1 hypothetical protein [Pseudomonas alcaligenes]
MAKVVLTLDDNGDRVTMGLSGAGRGETKAQRIAITLFELAEIDARLSQMPAHRKQPPSHTLH